MSEVQPPRGVIPARAVRRETEPVIVDAGNAAAAGGTMTVVPHADGARIAAVEVRCTCGNSILIDCEYEAER
jgi:hypothetical protein